MLEHAAWRQWHQFEGQGNLPLGNCMAFVTVNQSHLHRGKSLCPKGLQRGLESAKNCLTQVKTLRYSSETRSIYVCASAGHHGCSTRPCGRAPDRASQPHSYCQVLTDATDDDFLMVRTPDPTHFIFTSKQLHSKKQLPHPLPQTGELKPHHPSHKQAV